MKNGTVNPTMLKSGGEGQVSLKAGSWRKSEEVNMKRLGKIIAACIIGIIGAILVAIGKIIQYVKRKRRK